MKNVIFPLILVFLYGCGGPEFTSGFSADVQVEADSGLPPGTGGSVVTSTGGAPSAGTGGSGGILKLSAGGATSSTGGVVETGGSVGTGGTTETGGASSNTGGADTSTGGSVGSCSSGQKLCGNVCVPPAPSNGCDPTSCTRCPTSPPPNGVSVCTNHACDFDCLSGYTKQGSSCVPDVPVVCGGQTCTNSCPLAKPCCKTSGGCGCGLLAGCV